jgi:2'-5' RNA ligase
MDLKKFTMFLREDGVSEQTKKTGCMVAFYPPSDVASKLAIKDGEDPSELHVTLGYLGKLDQISNPEALKEAMSAFALKFGPIKGDFGGVGRFSASDTSDSKDVIYASADVPELVDFRHNLILVIESTGVQISRIHGFTPHMTLSYVDINEDTPIRRIEHTEVLFESVWLVLGEEKIEYKLTGSTNNQ